MLSFKPEVRIIELGAALQAVLAAAAQWSLRSKVDVHVSAVDETPEIHNATTLHGWSLAADINVMNGVAADRTALGEYLRRALPPGYEVIFEVDHIHVEYDMHRPVLKQ